jgi:HK97 family phage major capsid protein
MNEDLKGLLDKLGSDYNELKQTVEQKAKQAAEGAVDPLITAKLKTINEAINAADEKREKVVNDLKSRIDALSFNGAQGKADGLTVEQREYRAALGGYLRKGHDAGLRAMEAKALSVGSDQDGGYTVESDKTGRIVTRIFETSPMRQHAQVVTISTDRYEGLRDTDEAGAEWVSETGTRSTTDTPTLGQWAINVHELSAKPRATQKLLDDSMLDIEAWLGGKVADQFARTQNTAFVVGTGVGKPRGFASYTTAATADASRAWGAFEHVATASNGSFGTDPAGLEKLIAVKHKLNPAYLAGSGWFMNRSTLADIRTLTDASSAGGFVFVPDFTGQTAGSILGYPVHILEDMVIYSTTNALAVAFGNMRETYTIVDRLGIRVLRDPFSAKPYVEFYTTARVGGDVLNFNALKFVKMGS